MMLSIFSCAYWPFVYFLWRKCLFRSFTPFFGEYQIVFFLILNFLIYFVIKVLKNCCTMLCQFPLYTKVTQSLLMYIHIHSFSCIFFYHCLSQETGYSSLCYRVGPHCLSILNLYSFFNQLTCLFSIEFLTYWIQFPFRHMIGKYFFFHSESMLCF